MARRVKRLGVWMHGVHVADLEQDRWPAIRCRYTPLAFERWAEGSPVLSCSLRLRERPIDALAFCKGLLPEGQALQHLASQAGVAVNETFGLLERYGRDVAGALVIGDDPPDHGQPSIVRYDATSLAEAVDALHDRPFDLHDDSELSLAGLQDKLLLVATADGGWARPVHGFPSTHILKADDLVRRGLVATEADCLTLARAVALTSVDATIARFGDRDCLIVSRFDRTAGRDGTTERVHQEDICQALGIDPDGARGRAKYERFGGPGLRDVARLLDAHAAEPLAQLDRLVEVVTFTCLIGNADAHGKNLALLHDGEGHVGLAPLYDTVPTVLWPKLRRIPAMHVAGEKPLDTVTLDDVTNQAATWGVAPRRAARVASELVDRTIAALDAGAIDPASRTATLVRAHATRLSPPDP